MWSINKALSNFRDNIYVTVLQIITLYQVYLQYFGTKKYLDHIDFCCTCPLKFITVFIQSAIIYQMRVTRVKYQLTLQQFSLLIAFIDFAIFFYYKSKQQILVQVVYIMQLFLLINTSQLLLLVQVFYVSILSFLLADAFYTEDTSQEFVLVVILIFSQFCLLMLIKEKMVKEIIDAQPVVNALNQMASTLMTSFVNALPTKLLPIILQSKDLPCDIVPQVIYIYIHLKTQDEHLTVPDSEESIQYLSRVNSFYCILDFFSDICGVQKIKSSYSYYMACTGAQYFLEAMNGQIPESQYQSQYQQHKLMTFFALAAQEVAKAYQLECSCGITKGNIVVGVLGLGSANVNLDTYGDTINTAARIARNADIGVHVSIDSFINCSYQNIDKQDSNKDIDNQFSQFLLKGDIFNQAKLFLLQSQPYYTFGPSLTKAYKGKGNIRTIEIIKDLRFEELILTAFKKAFVPFTHDVIVLNQKSSQDDDFDTVTNYFTDTVEDNDQEEDREFLSMIQQSFVQKSDSSNQQFQFQSSELSQMLDKKSPVQSMYSKILSKTSYKIANSLSASRQFNTSDCFQVSPSDLVSFCPSNFSTNGIIITDDNNDSDSSLSGQDQQQSTSLLSNTNSQSSALRPQLNNFLEMARRTNQKRDLTVIKEYVSEEEIQQDSISNSVLSMQINASAQSEFEDSFFSPVQNSVSKRESIYESGNKSIVKINQSVDSESQDYEFPIDKQQLMQINEENDKEDDIEDDDYQVDSVLDKLYFIQDYVSKSFLISKITKYLSIVFSLSTEIQKQFNKNKSYVLINIQSQNQWMLLVTGLFLIFSTITELIIISSSNIINTKIQIFMFEISLEKALKFPEYIQIALITLNLFFITQLMMTIRKQKKKGVFQNIKSYDQVKSVGNLQFYNLLGLFSLFCLKQYILLNASINVYLSYTLQISLITLQLLQLFVCIVAEFSYITMPQFYISRSIALISMFIFIFLSLFIIQQTFFATFILVVYITIMSVLFPLLSIYFGNILVNIKAIQQINSGRQLLRSVLPHITIDSLLATSSPEVLKKLIHQFPFLHKYQDTLLLLENMGAQSPSSPLIQHQISTNPSRYQTSLYKKFSDYLSLPNSRNLTQTRPVINFDNVAYLNLDIANFTQFSSSITVEQMMKFLDNLFHKFDSRISKAKNLIQIKISGDSYELMSLPCTLKIYTQDYKEKVVFEKVLPAHLQKLFETPQELRKSYDAIVILLAVGLGFIHDCKETMRKMFPQFENLVSLRVGIAYGNVIGSLLGHKLCRFDAFGKVPKEADSVQSNARLNSVAVSQLVFDIISYGKAEFQGHLYDVISQMEVNIGKTIDFTSEYVDFDYIISNQQICVQSILNPTGQKGIAKNSESVRDFREARK